MKNQLTYGQKSAILTGIIFAFLIGGAIGKYTTPANIETITITEKIIDTVLVPDTVMVVDTIEHDPGCPAMIQCGDIWIDTEGVNHCGHRINYVTNLSGNLTYVCWNCHRHFDIEAINNWSRPDESVKAY